MTAYQHRVYAVCWRMTGDRTAAEELCQDVFLKAFRALPEFRGDASPSTWLFQIATRTGLDWRRKRAREREHRSDSPLQPDAVPTDVTPETTYLGKEEAVAIRGLVHELSEPYRSMVTAYYFEHRSCREIAERTGLSQRTVESRLYRAKLMMKEKGASLR